MRFLGRSDELRRFETLLASIASGSAAADRSPVMLVQGLGGMGKSMLVRRFKAVTDASAVRTAATAVPVLVDFEDERRNIEGFSTTDGSLLLPVVMALHARCVAAFDEAGVGSKQVRRAFEHFVRAAANVPQVQQLSASGSVGQGREAAGIEQAAGIANSVGTVVGLPPALPGRLVEGAGFAVRARRRSGDATLLDALIRPEETLARTFAEGLRRVSEARPVILLLDTYELVAGIGGWLRSAMGQTGGNVAWVVAGRMETDTAAGETSDAAAFARELDEESLRIVRMTRFPDATIAELLERRGVADRSASTVDAIAKVTRGVPLAVDLVAGLLAQGASLAEAARPVDDAGDGTLVVTTLARRYLRHAHRDPALGADIPLLYGLALTRSDRTDPLVLQALWGDAGEVARQLEDLARRHDFVMTASRRLHVEVRDTFRSFLLDAARRTAVREANRRAAELLLSRTLSIAHESIDQQLQDDTWRAAASGLLWHEFWVDNDLGFDRLLELFPGAALLHRPFAHELVGVASFFVDTFSNAQRSLLRGLSSLLSFGQFVDGWLAKRQLSLLSDASPVARAGVPERPRDLDRHATLERMRSRRLPDLPVVSGAVPREALVALLRAKSAAASDPDHAMDALVAAAAQIEPADGKLAEEVAATAGELTRRLVRDLAAAGARPSQLGVRAAELATRYTDALDAQLTLALTLSRAGREDEAIAVYDAVIGAGGGDGETIEQQRAQSTALFDKAVVLRRQERLSDALASYRELIRRFGDEPDSELRSDVAAALQRIGALHGALDEPEQELEAYEEVVERFGEQPQPSLRIAVAGSLSARAFVLSRLGRAEEALAVFDLVVERFGEELTPDVRDEVCIALHNKAVALIELDRKEEALVVFGELDRRFGETGQRFLRRHVVGSLGSWASLLDQLRRHEDEMGVYDKLIGRYGDADDPELRSAAVRAAVNKGITLATLGRDDDAMEVYASVVARFRDDDAASVRPHVATAYRNLATLQELIGWHAQGIETADEFLARFGDDPDEGIRACATTILHTRGSVLRRLGRPDDALACFQQAAAHEGVAVEARLSALAALDNAAVLLVSLGRADEALERWREAARRFAAAPHDELAAAAAIAGDNLGTALRGLHRWEEALEAYDAVVSAHEGGTEVDVRRAVAMALHDGAVALAALGREEEALARYERLVAGCGDDEHLGVRVQVAMARVNSGRLLEKLGREQEACETLTAVASDDDPLPDPALRRQVALAMSARARIVGRAGRDEEQLNGYRDVVERFAADDDAEIQRLVAMTLNNAAVVAGKLGRVEEALAARARVIADYAGHEAAGLRLQVLEALIGSARVLSAAGREEEAGARLDQLAERAAGERDAQLLEKVAETLASRIDLLGRMNRHADVLAACDELAARFRGSDDPRLRKQAAFAASNRSIALSHLGRHGEAVEAAARFTTFPGADEDDADVRVWIASALLHRASVEHQLGRRADAIQTLDSVVRRFERDDDVRMRHQVLVALNDKAVLQGRAGADDAALDTYARVVEAAREGVPQLRAQYAMAHANRAVVLSRLGRDEEALADYGWVIDECSAERSPQLRRRAHAALLARAFAFSRLRRHSAVVEDCRRYVEEPDAHAPEDLARAHNLAASALVELGEPDEAVRWLSEVLRRFGGDPDADIVAHAGHAARRLLDLGMDGADPARRAELAGLAEAAFERAMANDPDAATIGNHALFVHQHCDDPERAASLYRRAVAEGGDVPAFRANYARLLFEQGDLEHAIEVADEAAELVTSVSETDAAEVAVYLLALGPPMRREALLLSVAGLIGRGVRSVGWDFDGVLARARALGREDPLVEAIAAVVARGADPATLDDHAEWRELSLGTPSAP